MRGQLIIISGAAGTGKGTVVKGLLARNANICLSVSATTRLPRPGETNGVEYFFKTREEFEEMVKANAFIEYTCYNGNYYGTPKQAVLEMLDAGKSVILEIEVEGAANAARALPEAILVFLAPPSMKVLKERLIGRGTETAEVVESRMQIAKREVALAHSYKYIVVNDEVERAVETIEAILVAERALTVNNRVFVDELNK